MRFEKIAAQLCIFLAVVVVFTGLYFYRDFRRQRITEQRDDLAIMVQQMNAGMSKENAVKVNAVLVRSGHPELVREFPAPTPPPKTDVAKVNPKTKREKK